MTVDVPSGPSCELNLLILGGSVDHPGGVESFCERASSALVRKGGWRITRAETNTAYLRVSRLGGFLAGLGALVRHCVRRPDCIWLQYGNLPDLAFLVIAKLMGIRVMVTPHLGSNWRSQSNPFLRGLSRRALRLADRLALISRTQEQEIAFDCAIPRSLIRTFIPRETLAIGGECQHPPEIQLIHSGRLSEGKGSFLFVDVCEKLRDAGVPLLARIVGGADPATQARLEQTIAERGLTATVMLLGHAPEHELLEHLRRSDLLVHLSRIDSYPLIVLEAMACATIPICMELAGARDQIDTYGGHIVSQERPVEETVDWIMRVDINEIRRQGLVVAERVRADYDWDRCAVALDAALRACVSNDRKALTQPEPVG